MTRNNIIIYPFNEENALPQCVFFTNAIILKGENEYDSMLKQAKPDWSIPTWAFHWLMGLDNVTMVLSGMSTMDQIRDNVETFQTEERLTAEENMLLIFG
ncbi:MAG: hypothetical protein ACOX8E_12490 [Ruminococcus sp.]|jgi:predicted aldo/keto reductase-like oxidoreductase